MAVLIPEVLREQWLQVEGLLDRLQMSTHAYRRRVRGEVPWGEEEIETALDWIQERGRALARLRRSDLVEAGTVLRPRNRQLLRPRKDR